MLAAIFVLWEDVPTSQTIDSPLFELLECDVCCWGCDIEIEPILVLQSLVFGRLELFRSMVESRSSLGVNSCKLLADHIGGKLVFIVAVVVVVVV